MAMKTDNADESGLVANGWILRLVDVEHKHAERQSIVEKEKLETMHDGVVPMIIMIVMG